MLRQHIRIMTVVFLTVLFSSSVEAEEKLIMESNKGVTFTAEEETITQEKLRRVVDAFNELRTGERVEDLSKIMIVQCPGSSFYAGHYSDIGEITVCGGQSSVASIMGTIAHEYGHHLTFSRLAEDQELYKEWKRTRNLQRYNYNEIRGVVPGDQHDMNTWETLADEYAYVYGSPSIRDTVRGDMFAQVTNKTVQFWEDFTGLESPLEPIQIPELVTFDVIGSKQSSPVYEVRFSPAAQNSGQKFTYKLVGTFGDEDGTDPLLNQSLGYFRKMQSGHDAVTFSNVSPAITPYGIGYIRLEAKNELNQHISTFYYWFDFSDPFNPKPIVPTNEQEEEYLGITILENPEMNYLLNGDEVTIGSNELELPDKYHLQHMVDIADKWEKREQVAPGKDWTIKFNMRLMAGEPLTNNILVLDETYRPLPDVSVKLDSSGQQVIVRNSEMYEAGRTYYLLVTPGILSQQDKRSEESVVMPFTVQ